MLEFLILGFKTPCGPIEVKRGKGPKIPFSPESSSQLSIWFHQYSIALMSQQGMKTLKNN